MQKKIKNWGKKYIDRNLYTYSPSFHKRQKDYPYIKRRPALTERNKIETDTKFSKYSIKTMPIKNKGL